jgi:hypothetical protein
VPYEYLFERERKEWDPVFSAEKPLVPMTGTKKIVVLAEARGGYRNPSWKLVKGLVPRESSARVRDQAALTLAAPDSGSFILVSLSGDGGR